MPSLTWDRVGDKTYESGLDKGVLYLPDGSAVVWNGLTSVIESFDKETTPVYYDGMKINELVTLGDFSATMTAVTYPDEFSEVEGMGSLRRGGFLGDQTPQSFGLCYRTMVGNDLSGSDYGYKIHIVYNLVAIPSDKTYASLSDSPTLVEFEWKLTAVPEELPGFRPTAHIVINSKDFDPWLLEDLEGMLYGSSTAFAALIPMPDLVTYISEWARVRIVDNGDGTWSAVSERPGFIEFLNGVDLFQINQANAVYLDDVTYEITDTFDESDAPNIKLVDNGDGTWTASTDSSNVIVMLDETTFEIRNVEALFDGGDLYRISDTTF